MNETNELPDASELLEILKDLDEHSEPGTEKIFVVAEEDKETFLSALIAEGCMVYDSSVISPWGCMYMCFTHEEAIEEFGEPDE